MEKNKFGKKNWIVLSSVVGASVTFSIVPIAIHSTLVGRDYDHNYYIPTTIYLGDEDYKPLLEVNDEYQVTVADRGTPVALSLITKDNHNPKCWNILKQTTYLGQVWSCVPIFIEGVPSIKMDWDDQGPADNVWCHKCFFDFKGSTGDLSKIEVCFTIIYYDELSSTYIRSTTSWQTIDFVSEAF